FDAHNVSGVETVRLAVGDFDGDGFGDVVRSAYWDGWTLFDGWRGDSLGSSPTWGYPLVPDAIATGDLDGNGGADLVIATSGSLGIRYGLGAFDGNELFGCFEIHLEVAGAWTLATGDFD